MNFCQVYFATLPIITLLHFQAILPYSQALEKFAPHIQQVSMESNGKGVSIDGVPLPLETGEIDFGEPGTNGQHSFYQLIHQVIHIFLQKSIVKCSYSVVCPPCY
ncbi:Glucose-6-phosphate isomerase, cytosolic [Linum perenne]